MQDLWICARKISLHHQHRQRPSSMQPSFPSSPSKEGSTLIPHVHVFGNVLSQWKIWPWSVGETKQCRGICWPEEAIFIRPSDRSVVLQEASWRRRHVHIFHLAARSAWSLRQRLDYFHQQSCVYLKIVWAIGAIISAKLRIYLSPCFISFQLCCRALLHVQMFF